MIYAHREPSTVSQHHYITQRSITMNNCLRCKKGNGTISNFHDYTSCCHVTVIVAVVFFVVVAFVVKWKGWKSKLSLPPSGKKNTRAILHSVLNIFVDDFSVIYKVP